MKAFPYRVLCVILGAMFGASLLISKASAQENSGSDSTKNLPCVTASSSCPLDFTAIPDPLLPQMTNAKKLFENGDFAGAQKVLEALRLVQPDSRTIVYDLALVCLKQGQRDQALSYQQQALRGATHPNQRRVLDELGQAILYGNGARDETNLAIVDVLPPPDVTGKDANMGSSRNPSERAETEIKSVCAAVAERQKQMMHSPSGVFNLAQCAEYQGRLEEAEKLYNRYLEMAPETLDRDSVALRVSEIDSFKDVDPSSPLRKTYHTGVRALMTGRFTVANESFIALSAGGPGSRVGLLQAAMLALFAGQRTQADKYLDSLLGQETNTDMRDYIGRLLKAEQTGNEEFSAGIKEVLKFTEEYDFVQAWEAIQKPLSIYPLSPAVNALAIFVALNTNNYPAARRAMDNLWSQGQLVFFYASVESSSQKGELVYRVQMSSDHLVLVRVRAGAKLAELVQGMQEGKPQDPAQTAGSEQVEFARKEITKLHSTGSDLVIETSKGQWRITPLVAFFAPKEGWPARAFMNDYADLFSTYLGLSNVELGDESTNSADRWRLVGKIALAALAGYAQGGGGYLNLLHGTAKTIVAAEAVASAAIAGTKEYRLYVATLNNTLNRFLFRPLVAGGSTITFMIPERSDRASSDANSTLATKTGAELLVWYSKSKTKKQEGSAGFATLHLDKDQIRLLDTEPVGPSISVPCTVVGDSLFATETHTEARNGQISSTPSPTPWTIESTYFLRIERPTKEDSEILLKFRSSLSRAQVRMLVESHCQTLGVRFFETNFGHHLSESNLHSVPPCENLTKLTLSFVTGDRISVPIGILELQTTQTKSLSHLLLKPSFRSPAVEGMRRRGDDRQVLQGDPQQVTKLGYKLAQACGLPLYRSSWNGNIKN